LMSSSDKLRASALIGGGSAALPTKA